MIEPAAVVCGYKALFISVTALCCSIDDEFLPSLQRLVRRDHDHIATIHAFEMQENEQLMELLGQIDRQCMDLEAQKHTLQVAPFLSRLKSLSYVFYMFNFTINCTYRFYISYQIETFHVF